MYDIKSSANVGVVTVNVLLHVGTIPPALAGLTALTWLNTHGNQLIGENINAGHRSFGSYG